MSGVIGAWCVGSPNQTMEQRERPSKWTASLLTPLCVLILLTTQTPYYNEERELNEWHKAQ